MEAVFPDSTPAPERSLNRLRLAVLAALGLLAVGAAVLVFGRVSGRAGGAVPFSYLHGARSGASSPAPTGEADTVFRLSGPRGQQAFTLAQLEALPAVQYRATQPQLKQSFVYTGVPLRDLAEAAGLPGRNLRISGDDQFAATVQASDYLKFPVMLAYLADGRPMTARQKGPLMVVFPTEQAPDHFTTFAYGSQWVWFAGSLSAAP